MPAKRPPGSHHMSTSSNEAPVAATCRSPRCPAREPQATRGGPGAKQVPEGGSGSTRSQANAARKVLPNASQATTHRPGHARPPTHPPSARPPANHSRTTSSHWPPLLTRGRPVPHTATPHPPVRPPLTCPLSPQSPPPAPLPCQAHASSPTARTPFSAQRWGGEGVSSWTPRVVKTGRGRAGKSCTPVRPPGRRQASLNARARGSGGDTRRPLPRAHRARPSSDRCPAGTPRSRQTAGPRTNPSRGPRCRRAWLWAM